MLYVNMLDSWCLFSFIELVVANFYGLYILTGVCFILFFAFIHMYQTSENEALLCKSVNNTVLLEYH